MQLIAAPRLPLPPDMRKAWLAVPLGWRYAAAMLIAPVAGRRRSE